jgi:hypothetical protein
VRRGLAAALLIPSTVLTSGSPPAKAVKAEDAAQEWTDPVTGRAFRLASVEHVSNFYEAKNGCYGMRGAWRLIQCNRDDNYGTPQDLLQRLFASPLGQSIPYLGGLRALERPGVDGGLAPE